MFSELISYASALGSCWRRHTELDYFFREDVDEVVVFGRMDDAKLDLKRRKIVINSTWSQLNRLEAYPKSFSLKGRILACDGLCQTAVSALACLTEYIDWVIWYDRVRNARPTIFRPNQVCHDRSTLSWFFCKKRQQTWRSSAHKRAASTLTSPFVRAVVRGFSPSLPNARDCHAFERVLCLDTARTWCIQWTRHRMGWTIPIPEWLRGHDSGVLIQLCCDAHGRT